jgi:hypothetical protein
MKKLWDLNKLFSDLEPERQGRGIIMGVTCLLLLGLFYTIQTKEDQTFWRGVYLVFYQISCSWHQNTKQSILFSPIFSTNFSQLEQLKKKANFLLVQNSFFFLGFGPMRSLFSFLNAKLRKIRRKIWGKQDWWFDVTKK